ncbi:hypothetical protein Moror_2840 [Moniliophthora roreri MCA 2997]|uniref:Mediator of RNA polymerase II transcription subunit 21 n=2 Tax=Moniliophthora roreri TaxID=221103 RepID=V2XFM3_MONRO|nr:hypothetical protein Moror_2840 [Moniliophthora roreri MCA 2997]
MLQELSKMDRITQLQDEIQNLLRIMSSSIAYLTTRTNFLQVSPDIPVTKQRNPEKYDLPEVFEANKQELVADLVVKAKQVEYLIDSLPEPESEEDQAKRLQALEEEMNVANEEYMKAVARMKALHIQVSSMLRQMLTEVDSDLVDAQS